MIQKAFGDDVIALLSAMQLKVWHKYFKDGLENLLKVIQIM